MLRADRYLVATVATLLCWYAQPAAAQHEDLSIYSSQAGGGQLVADYDFGEKIAVSDRLGFPVGGDRYYASANPGYGSPSGSIPGESLFAVASGTSISFEIVALDAGVSVKWGSTVIDAPGESATIGTVDLHVHPEYQLVAPDGVTGDYNLSFRLTTSAPAYADSPVYTFVLTNADEDPTVTPTDTAPATATATATATSTGTATAPATPTDTAIAAATPTETPAVPPTDTATATPTPTATEMVEFGCPLLPRDGCLTSVQPTRSLLLMKNLGGGRRKMVIKWLKGEATDLADFAEPDVSTSYAACIYSEDGGSPSLVMGSVVAPGGSCNGRPCWKQTRSGYVFRDRSAAQGGVKTVKLRAGDAGRAKLIFKALGDALVLPALPLVQSPRALVQIINDEVDGRCWEISLPAPPVTATTQKFKDKGE